MDKINLCGGYDKIEGYVNIDLLSKEFPHDLRNPIPIETSSIDTIVMSHGLNYFTYEEAQKLVCECYRILKLYGIIRVILPDLRKWAKYYLDNNIEFLFQKKVDGTDRFVGKTAGDKFISQAYYYGGSKYFYDFESARELFRNAGFSTIKNCKYLESLIPNIEQIDNRPELSFYLEAQK